MWRKIHSNRDPRDTLYSEIQKEFGAYFNAAGHFFKRLINAHPRTFFGMMIFIMITSAILSFTVFRHPEPEKVRKKIRIDPVGDGFSNILQTASKIREAMRLKQVIDSLSAKKELSSADSTALEEALDSLQQLQH